jgi:hypothetical protein
MELELRLRVKLLDPVPGVVQAMQIGATATREFAAPVRRSAKELVFETTVRVVAESARSAVRFRGPSVHGPTDDRFLYINSGKQAGQPNTEWDRRLKVRLSGITPAMLKAAAKSPDLVLECSLPGRARDGGPSCATVPFISDWKIM